MATITIDVDGVVVEPYYLWWQWMECTCGVYRPMPERKGDELVDYDLSKYFKKELKKLRVDALDFWRGTDVYNFLRPMPGSVEVIKKLAEEGHKIMWATHCKGFHTRSKYRFIERNYPIKGFFATKEKHEIRTDVMIDDRVDVLNKFYNNESLVLFDSPFTQKESPALPMTTVKNWNQVYEFIRTL